MRTFGAERTATPNHILELALNHSLGSGLERAYRRSDLLAERARFLESWARYCTSPSADTTANVVNLRRAAAE
jgi:hypothetical protein